MSHNVDKKADGTGAMFSVGEVPWHQGETNSTVLKKPPRTAIEVAKAGGMNWEVQLRKAFFEVGNNDYLEIEGAYAVVRKDRNRAVGVVGSIYQPFQNIRMLETLQPLVDQGLATWETGGVLNFGRRVWAQVRLNLESKIIKKAYEQKGDQIIPFEIMLNRHDGSGKIILGETRQRVVCQNTEIMALHDMSGRITTEAVRHDSDVEVNVIKAAERLWKDLVSRHELLAKQVIQLRRTRLDDKLFRELVLDTALPMPVQGTDSELAKKLIKSRTEKIEGAREILVKLWTDGLGQTGDHSAWEAMNAVTEAADHDRGVWSPKSRLVANMPGGHLQDVKSTVYAKLLAYSNKKNTEVALSA